MTEHALRFDHVEWQQINELARQKLIEIEDKRVRLLELSEGFQETEWCTRGHIGFVVSGTIEVELPERTESFSAGNAFLLPAGEQHKARTPDGNVQLFLVDEI